MNSLQILKATKLILHSPQQLALKLPVLNWTHLELEDIIIVVFL